MSHSDPAAYGGTYDFSAGPVLPKFVALVSFNAPQDGVCGGTNGSFSSVQPTGSLCNAGAASAVSAATPWTWHCNGINGGMAASCSAFGKGNSLTDALKAYQSVRGMVQLTADETKQLDVAPLDANGMPAGNGSVDIADVIAILRRNIGIGTW